MTKPGHRSVITALPLVALVGCSTVLGIDAVPDRGDVDGTDTAIDPGDTARTDGASDTHPADSTVDLGPGDVADTSADTADATIPADTADSTIPGDTTSPVDTADSASPTDTASPVDTADSATAPDTADAGIDTAVCSPPSTRCSGNVPETCVGGAWSPSTVCSAFCSGGSCISPPSCSGGATCGLGTPVSCCSATHVPAGSFKRSYDGVTTGYTDPKYTASVSEFVLDTFEVNVARFRNFVAAYPATIPSGGVGKNPADAADTGWNTTWNTLMPAAQSDLKAALACPGGTWLDSGTANDRLPINCVSWYLAYAFCVWDGGRLPTEAEWNYAAAGGGDASGQRVYPWNTPPSAAISAANAVYSPAALAAVGSKSPTGDGRWGQSDLAGNIAEWVRDYYVAPYASTTCVDCAYSTATSARSIRGGNYLNVISFLLTSYRNDAPPAYTDKSVGFRCVHQP